MTRCAYPPRTTTREAQEHTLLYFLDQPDKTAAAARKSPLKCALFSPSKTAPAAIANPMPLQAMLTRLLSIALHTCATSSLSLPPTPQLLPNRSPIAAVPTNTSSTPPKNGDCFSDHRLHPTSHIDCFHAASGLLDGIADPLRPKTFARKGNVGFKLPKTVREGSCVISLDVTHDDDRDRLPPWMAYTAALDLASECVGGVHGLGGRRIVGPKGVVELVVFGREGAAGDGDGEGGGGLGLEISKGTAVDGGGREGDVAKTGNTALLELATRSLVNASSLDAHGMCFTMPRTQADQSAVDRGDCYRAAGNMIEGKPRDIPWLFSRNPNATFHLPATFDSGACSINVDVLDATDEDAFEISTLYDAALDVANRCTMSPGQAVEIWGGNRRVGFKGLVNVVVSGMASLLLESEPTTPGNAHVIIRSLAESKVPTMSHDSSVREALAGSGKPAIISNGSSANIVTRLGAVPTCYDPPLPRELLYPYVSSDCDKASDKIIGDRNKWAAYIFSRKPSTSPYWYQLPVKYTYGSCVIHIDMENDKAEDAVRVTYVASSAWVLARKCSGEEDPEYRYGGFMTVSVGAADLISIHVYGRPWPPLTGQSPTLALLRNASSVDRE